MIETLVFLILDYNLEAVRVVGGKAQARRKVENHIREGIREGVLVVDAAPQFKSEMSLCEGVMVVVATLQFKSEISLREGVMVVIATPQLKSEVSL